MASKASGVHVALLRGINVGGKNKLPMKQLLAMFTAAGGADARAYIQSGNVLFRATPAQVSRIPSQVHRQIQAELGFSSPVIVRSAQELARVVAKNPFLARGVEPEKLHVAFLESAPAARAVKSLDASRSPGDELEVIGREVYLHLPNGVGRSKLTNAYFDSRLETVSTLRNWRTVLKLVELAGEMTA